jgi:hypothetical protein
LIHNADDIKNYPQKCINGDWVIARPDNYRYESIANKTKTAWKVLIGECDAVKFTKKEKES